MLETVQTRFEGNKDMNRRLKRIAQGSSAVAFAYLIGKGTSLDIFAEETKEENKDEAIIEETEGSIQEADLTNTEDDSPEDDSKDSSSEDLLEPISEDSQKNPEVTEESSNVEQTGSSEDVLTGKELADKIYEVATKKQGEEYTSSGKLVADVLKEVTGENIVELWPDQYQQYGTTFTDKNLLIKGNLVYYNTGNKATDLIGIYIGDNKIIIGGYKTKDSIIANIMDMDGASDSETTSQTYIHVKGEPEEVKPTPDPEPTPEPEPDIPGPTPEPEPDPEPEPEPTPEPEQVLKDLPVSDKYDDTKFILSQEDGKDIYVKVSGYALEQMNGKLNLNYILESSWAYNKGYKTPPVDIVGMTELDRSLVLLGWKDESGTFLSRAETPTYGTEYAYVTNAAYYQLSKETSGKTYYAVWGKGIKSTEFISEDVLKWSTVVDEKSLTDYLKPYGQILDGGYSFNTPTNSTSDWFNNLSTKKTFYMWNTKADGSGQWYKNLSDFFLAPGQTNPSGQYLTPDYQPDKLYAIWVDALFSSDVIIKGDITIHLNNGTEDTLTILGNEQGYTPNELQTLIWEIFSRSEYEEDKYEAERNRIPNGKAFLAVLPVSSLNSPMIDEKADWSWNTNEYYIIWQDKSTMEPYLLRKESDWKLIDIGHGYRIANRYTWSIFTKQNQYRTSYDETVKDVNYMSLNFGKYNTLKFNPRNYSSITFVANNGTSDKQQISFDDLYKTNGTFLPNIPQAPAGFEFIGWNLKANASGIWVQKGSDTSSLMKYLFSQDYYPPEKVYAIFMRIAGSSEKPLVGSEYNGIYIAPGVELPNGEVNISTIENENGRYVISVKKTKTVKKQITVKRKRYVTVGKQSSKTVQTASGNSLRTSLAGIILSAAGLEFLRRRKQD